MKYQHLLVPVDFTVPVSSAIETALNMAAQHQARTTLLYVIESIDSAPDEPDDDIDSFYAGIEASIQDRLARIARRFESAGLPVDCEVVVGHHVREIVHYSATRSIDLIVMDSQRVDPNQPGRTVGSVSHQVSVFCQCPVMLIK